MRHFFSGHGGWQAGRLLLSACFVLALSLASFAHRPSSPDLSAYVLPDGSLAVLCISDGGPAEPGKSIDACPFCVVAKSVAMPPRWATSIAAPPPAHVGFASKATPKPIAPQLAAHRSRAPPASA